MEKKLITIDDYIKEKEITLQEFQRITGVCYSRLSAARHKLNPVFDLNSVVKIWMGTKKKYGVGLMPSQYMSLPDMFKE